MALLKITHFWSNLLAWGYQRNFHFYGNVDPLECIFMALLALSNEGVPAHFFHFMEAPTMRLPNVKMLLCWSSRMHIYGFVQNRTFLEQFVSMGVPAHFFHILVLYCASIWGTSAFFHILVLYCASIWGIIAFFHILFLYCASIWGIIAWLPLVW